MSQQLNDTKRSFIAEIAELKATHDTEITRLKQLNKDRATELDSTKAELVEMIEIRNNLQ
jgi:hypothetical protein